MSSRPCFAPLEIIARAPLHDGATGISTPSAGARTALNVSLLVAVALAAVSGAGLGAYDAGRFCGLVGAVLLLMRARKLDDSEAGPPGMRMARMAAGLVLLGVAVWSSTWMITTPPGLAIMSTMAVSAALHASVLLVPALGRRGS